MVVERGTINDLEVKLPSFDLTNVKILQELFKNSTEYVCVSKNNPDVKADEQTIEQAYNSDSLYLQYAVAANEDRRQHPLAILDSNKYSNLTNAVSKYMEKRHNPATLDAKPFFLNGKFNAVQTTHNDDYDNFALVLRGQKTFYVAPYDAKNEWNDHSQKGEEEHMYRLVIPAETTSLPSPTATHPRGEWGCKVDCVFDGGYTALVNQYESWRSKYAEEFGPGAADVYTIEDFWDQVLEQPKLEVDYTPPNFEECLESRKKLLYRSRHFQKVVLRAGQWLYIPRRDWHYVVTEPNSILSNWWWTPNEGLKRKRVDSKYKLVMSSLHHMKI
tara:strand:+ start:1050 stop:2039 length:990 start_codon:yes stop_codon:yes gene_type:complete